MFSFTKGRSVLGAINSRKACFHPVRLKAHFRGGRQGPQLCVFRNRARICYPCSIAELAVYNPKYLRVLFLPTRTVAQRSRLAFEPLLQRVPSFPFCAPRCQ